MEDKEKKNNAGGEKSTSWLLPVTAILVVLIVVGIFAGGGYFSEILLPEQAQPSEEGSTPAAARPAWPALTVDSVEQQDTQMVVSTSYAAVQYPFAFSDLIKVTAVDTEERIQLEFKAALDGKEYPMFALRFGGSEGTMLGTIDIDEAAMDVPVWLIFYSEDPDMDPGSRSSFYAAQESVNDVVASLTENEDFTPAQ